MATQMMLDFDFATEMPPESEVDEHCWLRRADLTRAVLAWLAENGAAGAATRVPTKRATYKADVAAFWSAPRTERSRGRSATINTVIKTMIIECRSDRESCWPDCTNSAELLPQLRDANRELRDVEAIIRKEEPHLKACDNLFEEYAEWNYKDSKNETYAALQKTVRRLEGSLYRGTRFETLRNAHVADHAYLVVPENAVHPREVASGWGLIWVNANYEVTMVTHAEELAPSNPVRNHLMQNIASAAFQDVLFRNGIGTDAEGPFFNRVPKRRRRESF